MKDNIRIYITVLGLLVLSACKLSRDIPAPKDAAPGSYRNAPADTANIATIPWKAFFSDSFLVNLVDTALEKNYDLQLALQNMEAARLILRQSRYGNTPIVTAQVNAGLNRPSDNSLGGLNTREGLGRTYAEDYTAAAGLSWEADIWGKVKRQKAGALARYLQSGEARKFIQTNIIAELATGYYNLLMFDDQLAVAQKNLLLNDSTLRIIKLQYDAGQVTALAVQQAEAQRLVSAQLIPEIRQNTQLQENALCIIAAVPPSEIKRKSFLTETVIPESPATGIPADLLGNRSDVKSAELALSIANANVGIAKANMYPALTITAAGGLNAFKVSNWFSIPASLFGNFAGGITQPVFQKKELKTKYELAKNGRAQSVIAFRQSVLKAAGEVTDALVAVEKLKEQQSIAVVRTGILEASIHNAGLLFQNGMATYLEVITSQANMLQGELDLATLKNARLRASVDLYRALGGGWK